MGMTRDEARAAVRAIRSDHDIQDLGERMRTVRCTVLDAAKKPVVSGATWEEAIERLREHVGATDAAGVDEWEPLC